MIHSISVSTAGTPVSLLMIFLEYLGIPLPTELSYFVVRANVLHNHYSWLAAVVLLLLAHLAGSLTAYEIGRRVGHAGERRQLSGIQATIHSWYEKRGGLLVYGAQLIGHIRPWSSYVAGYAGMPRGEFISYSLSGAATLTAIMLIFAELISTLWRNSLILRISVNGLAGVVLTFSAIALVKQGHKLFSHRTDKEKTDSL